LSYPEYIWLALFNYYFQGFWIAAAVLLSFGGLQREKTKGTISYILSLPVVRAELLFSRLTVGVAEILALGIVPVLLVPALSPAVHEHYPVGQILLFASLMVIAGLVFFCFGFLLSSLFGGEFTGPVLGLCLVGTYFFVIRAKSLHWLSVLDTMSGEDVVNRGSYFLTGSIPWSGMLWSLLASGLLYLCAVTVNRRQDF
jgi:ABC-type transport system involved in multi-copper enzyme maturation permease subunit